MVSSHWGRCLQIGKWSYGFPPSFVNELTIKGNFLRASILIFPLFFHFTLFFPSWFFFFIGCFKGFADQQLLLECPATRGELLIHFRFWNYSRLFLPPNLGKGNSGFPRTCQMLGTVIHAIPLVPLNHPPSGTNWSGKKQAGIQTRGWLSESKPLAILLLVKQHLELWNLF